MPQKSTEKLAQAGLPSLERLHRKAQTSFLQVNYLPAQLRDDQVSFTQAP